MPLGGRRASTPPYSAGPAFAAAPASYFPLNAGTYTEKRAQQHQPIRRSQQLVAGPFRVGHEADDVAVVRADPGDVISGAVGVVDVPEHDAIAGSQPVKGALTPGEVAPEVMNRK